MRSADANTRWTISPDALPRNPRLHFESFPIRFRRQSAATLYRIVQGTLSNVRKHAPEAAVNGDAFGSPGKLGLIVEDDGPGFEQERRSLEPGPGPIRIDERAHVAGGNFTVKSRPRVS